MSCDWWISVRRAPCIGKCWHKLCERVFVIILMHSKSLTTRLCQRFHRIQKHLHFWCAPWMFGYKRPHEIAWWAQFLVLCWQIFYWNRKLGVTLVYITFDFSLCHILEPMIYYFYSEAFSISGRDILIDSNSQVLGVEIPYIFYIRELILLINL